MHPCEFNPLSMDAHEYLKKIKIWRQKKELVSRHRKDAFILQEVLSRHIRNVHCPSEYSCLCASCFSFYKQHVLRHLMLRATNKLATGETWLKSGYFQSVLFFDSFHLAIGIVTIVILFLGSALCKFLCRLYLQRNLD